jgi:hypothetical protein
MYRTTGVPRKYFSNKENCNKLDKKEEIQREIQIMTPEMQL